MTLASTYVLCQPGMEERADERDNKERQVHKHVTHLIIILEKV